MSLDTEITLGSNENTDQWSEDLGTQITEDKGVKVFVANLLSKKANEEAEDRLLKSLFGELWLDIQSTWARNLIVHNINLWKLSEDFRTLVLMIDSWIKYWEAKEYIENIFSWIVWNSKWSINYPLTRTSQEIERDRQFIIWKCLDSIRDLTNNIWEAFSVQELTSYTIDELIERKKELEIKLDKEKTEENRKSLLWEILSILNDLWVDTDWLENSKGILETIKWKPIFLHLTMRWSENEQLWWILDELKKKKISN